MSGDGHTVAVPLTYEAAWDALWDAMRHAEIHSAGDHIGAQLDAVLSAPPEVIAAAMGGEVSKAIDFWDDETGDWQAMDEPRTVIVLPPRGVTG